MMWTRRLSPPIAMVLLLAACSFDFRREVELEPGDVSGRALRGAEGPAPYARVHVSGTGKEHRTRSDGSFLVRGLVPGGFVVELIDDKDGDGWPERTTRRAFTLTRASHASGVFGETEVRPTWVSLGDVRLEGIVEAEGRVLRADGTPAVGARVYGLRSAQLPASDDGRGALDVEMPADAEIATDIDGRFRFPALPAGALSFVAFLPGEGVLLASPPTTRAASPGVKLRDIELTLAEAPAERRVLLDLVPAPSADELVRVHWVEPGETPPLGQGSFSRTDPDVHEGNASIPLEVPLGAGDLWVETSAGRFGVLRRQIATMPGLDVVRWGLLVLGDEDVCAGTAPDGTAIRDCDHDGLQGLPPLDGEDDPNAEIWRACAPQCANAFGEAALGASCRVDGQIYDCDDDGDGQADVTESPACYGPGRGADPDGDGLCGLDDPYPQCRENDPEHPSCRAGGSFTEFPPPVRPDFQGGEEDAGPTPDGGDAGDDGGSNVDAGPDGGPDAGAGAFATLLADAEVSDVIRFGSGAALAINSEAPLDLGSGCALDGEELTAMVVLLDETGACQWRVAVRHTGAATAPRGARVSKLAVLEGGELLIVGTYTRQLGVADGHNDWLVEEPQSSDVFLVVVDESGLVTRAEGAGFTVVATEAIEIGAVTPLPDGGFVLGASPPSGETAIEIDGEPIEVGVIGMRSYFLVAFDSTFTPRWHHRGESYWDQPRVRGGVVVGEGASEHVVALVGFNGAFSTDGAELSTEYGAVALLAIPTNGPGRGTVSWFQQLERVSHADGSVALDANGAIVVAVSSPWVLFFVDEDGWGDPLDLVGESTAVVRYDENGTRLGYHVWVARDFDSAISARKLERLPDGDFLIGGDYRRGFSLGPYDVFDASRENNIWVARVGLEEDVAQVRHLNLTAGHAYFRAMTSMPDGSTLVVGEGFRTLTLGGVQLDTGREGSEIPGGFVWRILPDGTSEDEQMDGFLEACTTAASCQSRSCAVPSWPTVVAGICAAICRVEEPDCPGNAACLPSGRDDGLGVCMVPDTCYRDEHCSDGRCNPFTLQCSPECSGQDDCASDESCYVELGVCVPDCRTDGCGVDEICAPNGGGHVCVPD